MREMIWRGIAAIVSRPAVANWLIRRAARTPYFHITSRDGSDVYMERYWLFNPYTRDAKDDARPPRWAWLPSIRIHRILRADDERHLHDHPWNARTIVLHGWYYERRPCLGMSKADAMHCFGWRAELERDPTAVICRSLGYTGRLLFGQYHQIDQVPAGGVWTLFFTWKKRGTWGFKVDGRKVPYREYLFGEKE